MHGQPRHAAQVCRSTLPDVVVVATKVLVRVLSREPKVESKKVLLLQSGARLRCSLLLTASPSLHFQLPLSMGFLLFNPIQNQCCSCSSDSLWATSSSPSAPSSAARLASGADPPEGFVEDLQDKVLLLGASDAQQVGSVSLAEEVRLHPA